jgi:putative alpha-1,2-mannosidase
MDEDDGTMSAWFVFTSMGLYPLIVGEPVYELFSPVFDRIELQMDEAAKVKTVIRTAGRKDMRQPLRRVTWNGASLPNFQIKHAQLAKGGELVFWY